jgi:hypothetical protein
MTDQTDIYFDFEFIEDGREIIPISLGMCTAPATLTETAPEIVAGRRQVGDLVKAEFYQEYEFDPARANEWVRTNVFPHLDSYREERVGTGSRRLEVTAWIKEWLADVCGDSQPRFWGYYPSYDWVCLAQHFGTMVQMPEGWPVRPECLMQYADYLGISSKAFPKRAGNEHNALADAEWNRDLHRYLKSRDE